MRSYAISAKPNSFTGDRNLLVKLGIKPELLKDLDDKQIAELLAALLYTKVKMESRRNSPE